MNSYLFHLIAIGANFLLSKLSPSNSVIIENGKSPGKMPTLSETFACVRYMLQALYYKTGSFKYIAIRCGRVVTDFLPYPKFSKSLLN